VRDYKQNVMLFALYHSTKSPTAQLLFNDIVKTIEQLSTTGLSIDLGKKDEYSLIQKKFFFEIRIGSFKKKVLLM
jgi:hypothetical protein